MIVRATKQYMIHLWESKKAIEEMRGESKEIKIGETVRLQTGSQALFQNGEENNDLGICWIHQTSMENDVALTINCLHAHSNYYLQVVRLYR